jgi:putative DNA primase/helicase
VVYCGAAYWYSDGSFIDDREVIDRLLVAEIPSVKISFYNEIKQQILMQAPIISKDKTLDIRLENGILRKGKFIEIDFQEFTPYVIKIPFYEESKPVKIVDEYLDFLSENDQSYKDRLLEILALPLITERDFKSMLAKLAIFVGGGGNGKGTLLQIIKRILGSNNCSNLSIKQMSDERYLSAMIGKLANLGDDLEEEYISKDAIKLLKNISTCDPIEVRRLYELPQRVELTGSLIFTSNHILKAREKGESWKRRVDWIPMYPIPKKKDPDFIKKLTTPAALKYWIRLLVEAYQRLYARREFTYCQKIAEFNDNYHMINNNIHEYLEDRIAEDFITRQKRECYREYKAWCEENDEHKLGSENFHDFLCKKFNLKLGRDFIFKNGRRTSKDTYKSL